MVNPAGYVPAYPDHAPVLDGDVHRVPVGVENGGRLYPAIHILLRDSLLQEGIDTNGPELTRTVRRPAPPRLGDAVHRADGPRSRLFPTCARRAAASVHRDLLGYTP